MHFQSILRPFSALICAGVLTLALSAPTQAAVTGQQQVSTAASEGRYAYLLFHRTQDDATRAMQATVTAEVEKSNGKTVLILVDVSNKADAALIAKYDATRMPLPCVVGLAPNGAVSGIYPLKVDAAQLQRAVLTPKYAEMVKALQDQKLTVVCMHPTTGGTDPAGVAEFEALSAFQTKVHRISVRADEAAESEFYSRMKVDPALTETTVVVFAPPGVFVGKFDKQVRGSKIAEAFHASGRCNCKDCQHNHKK